MIKKAVITAAGKGTRQYPATNCVQKELFPLVDRDGITKPTIQIIAEEALNAGIEEICMVVQPGIKEKFASHFQPIRETEKSFYVNKPWALEQSAILDRLGETITYVEQKTQEGFGHAVYCARDWVGNEPFLLMLGDHVYISGIKKSCANQLMDGYKTHQRSMIGLQQTPLEQIHLFGTAVGNRISDNPSIYQLTNVAEKPNISFAKQNLIVSSLPDNFFLCFFGMYLFTPNIFSILGEHINNNVREKGEIQLTSAISDLIQDEDVFGLEMNGKRLDMGTPIGYLKTQLALARAGGFELSSTQR